MIQRFNVDFMNGSYRRQLAGGAYTSQKGEMLRRVEASLMEVQDAGLLSHLDQFWASWRESWNPIRPAERCAPSY